MNYVLSKDCNIMGSSKRHTRSQTTKPCNDIAASEDPNNTRLLWKANSDGSIPCPPEELGGCGRSDLDLKRLFPQNMLSELEERANRIVRSEIFVKAVANRNDQCPCYDHSGKVRKHVVREAADRKGLSGNHLYCPVATGIKEDDLVHFQMHWEKGEPVIVSDVLQLTSGLSWEPFVVWRAMRDREIKKSSNIKDDHFAVRVLDCLDWCQVWNSISLNV